MVESSETKSKTYTLAVVSLVLGIFCLFAFLLFGSQPYLLWIPGELSGLVADFLFDLSLFFDRVHPQLVLLITPFLAISAVVFGHIARRRIRHSGAALAGKKLALTGLIMGYVCLPLYIFSSVVSYQISAEFWGQFEDFNKNEQPWVECVIKLPDGSGQVAFMRRHAHPFLAEYDRKIRFETECFRNVVQPLPTNTGGRTKINVHWYPESDAKGPFLRLRDHCGVYYLNLQRGVVMSLQDQEFRDVFPYTTSQYLGRLDGTKGPLCFIPADRAPEEGIKPVH